ncbi:IS5 family transposase [Polyangium fumosum]|nr:IS5 family transposase [Polyangium fumosum]
MDLTDPQWALLEPLIPAPRVRADRRGRPWKDAREVLNGILWIMRTGARWADLPERYPPYQTCHRRFQQWSKDGTLERILYALAGDLRDRGQLDLSEAFIDGTFVSAKKGGPASGRPKRGKGTKIMAIADGSGLPLAVCIASASPHEVTLVDRTLDRCFLAQLPTRLIGDKAYDSDALDVRLAEARGIEMIAPNRSNRKRLTQDLRPLRRYKRRWKVERLFAWLQSFRRIVVRYERHTENFRGFVHLGCIVLFLRRLLDGL